MYVPKKMVQNEFKELICPSPKDLFQRVGARIPNNNGSSDGSDYSEVVSFDNNKMNTLQRMSNEDYARYSDEMRKAEKTTQVAESNSVEDDNV